MSLDREHLRCFGGFDDNSLCNLLNDSESEDDESNQVQVISHSPYYNDNIYTFLPSKSNYFSIFSSNIDSVNSKFSELTEFIDTLRKLNFEFSAICLQECWLNESDDLSLLEIPGYNIITQGKICSRKGGLIIYLHENYSYDKLNIYDTSEIWEGLFIEIYGS